MSPVVLNVYTFSYTKNSYLYLNYIEKQNFLASKLYFFSFITKVYTTNFLKYMATPKKFFKNIKYTPKTKKIVCVICGNQTELSDYRRKLFHGSKKTETCLLIQKYLDIEITEDLHTDTACRKCVRDLQKIDSISSKLKSSYKETINSLLETHGTLSQTAKRQIPEDTSNTRRKALFVEKTSASEKEDIDNSFAPIEDFGESIKVLVSQSSSQTSFLINSIYLPLIETLALDDIKQIGDTLLQINELREYLKYEIIRRVTNEVQNLSLKESNSILRQCTKEKLKDFSLVKIIEEWKNKAPTFLSFLEACIANPSQKRNKHKKDDALLPGLVSAGSKLLSIFNQELNLFQHMNSIILLKGGCKKSAFLRLNATSDCLSYQQTLNLATKYGEDWNEVLQVWMEQVCDGESVEKYLITHINELKASIDMLNGDPVTMVDLILELSEAESVLDKHRMRMHPGFYFVGDNVDMRTKVRHMTMLNQNKDQHMYQLCAYENRVSGNHLDNTKPLGDANSVPYITFLPNEDDSDKMATEFAFLVAEIWAMYIPHFNVYRAVLPSCIEHQYMTEMKQKSKRINLGVLMKNEQYNEDMTDICEFLHKFVPGNDNTEDWTKQPTKILSGGDYLTFERHKQAQSSKRNGRTPSKRLEGLVPKMEEFHNQGELLQVIWKLLYSTASAADQGTLYASRNTINAKNVTKDPADDFYASSDLVEKVTIAYIITGALDYFLMENIDGNPNQHTYTGTIGEASEMKTHILDHARKFVDQFVDTKVPSLPDYGPQSNNLKCRYCEKNYKQPKALRKHEAKIHQHKDPAFSPNYLKESTYTDASNKDYIYNYTRLCLTLGLIRLNHNDAIHMGDGERMMRINKYLYLYYKACHCPKYAYGILETLSQSNVLLTERMAHRLVWNRTVNHRGAADSNHPNDLDIEHCNKIFKEEAHSFRGVFTEKTVSRVSRSALTLDDIAKQFENVCSIKSPSGKHTSADIEHDIITLVAQFHHRRLFRNLPGRSHNAYQHLVSNPLFSLDMENVRDWIGASLKKFSQKHFY